MSNRSTVKIKGLMKANKTIRQRGNGNKRVTMKVNRRTRIRVRRV